jgi:hypothetical protein
MIFAGVWKMIGHLIDPETREKIQILKESDPILQIFQTHGLPPASIPTYLGGQHAGRAMNNTFKPSIPDTPMPAYYQEPVPQSTS